MNFCNPHEDDKPIDWLFSSLAFTGALSSILKINEGIIVEAKNDFLNIAREEYPDWKGTKLVIWKSATQIHIDICEHENLEDGQLIWMHK